MTDETYSKTDALSERKQRADAVNNATLRHITRILIIEDSDEVGQIMQATLQKMNMITFRETEGAKGLETFERIHPDLVLLDIALPDMDGWKVLDLLKEKKDFLKRLAIIVVTAYGDPANRLMGRLQGVDDYLVKPFKPEDLQRVVNTVLNMGRHPLDNGSKGK